MEEADIEEETEEADIEEETEEADVEEKTEETDIEEKMAEEQDETKRQSVKALLSAQQRAIQNQDAEIFLQTQEVRSETMFHNK